MSGGIHACTDPPDPMCGLPQMPEDKNPCLHPGPCNIGLKELTPQCQTHPHLLARSVQELHRQMLPFVTFADEEILERITPWGKSLAEDVASAAEANVVITNPVTQLPQCWRAPAWCKKDQT